LPGPATPGKFGQRSLLRDAVFGAQGSTYNKLWGRHPAATRTSLSGTVLDVSPDVIVLGTADGERRLALSPRTVAWRGSAVPPAALRTGDVVIVRHLPGRNVAERIWARIGRVTGTIIEADGNELIVDEGPTRRGRQTVRIHEQHLRQVQVRFPRLEPGYLVDVIGMREPGYLLAFTPATAQPPYRADHAPAAPPLSGRLPAAASGTAVWHEPGEEAPDLIGLA